MSSHFAPPTRTMSLDGTMAWPQPTFVSGSAWHDDEGEVEATPVMLETVRGWDVQGQMLVFDPERRSMVFRFDAAGGALRVPFARLRRMTLSAPLVDAAARLTFAGQLRKFCVELTSGEALVGRSAGHVENASGLYLFTPDENEQTLHRTFVPAAAYARCVLGPSVEEEASQRWLKSPREVAEAIDSGTMRHKVLAIGEALHNLGIVSARQIAAALEQQASNPRAPLGEMLITAGLLTRADLRTAMGHKMGYPLVDLRHFDLDPYALRQVPLEVAFQTTVLPLLLHRHRLVVAVDNLAGLAQLHRLSTIREIEVVPVLARHQHIEAALLRAYHDHGEKAWSDSNESWETTASMPT